MTLTSSEYARSVTLLMETCGIAVHFGERCALAGVSIEIASGTTTAVIGPNGSGKSTLLGVLAGLEPPVEGEVDRHGGSVAIVLQSTTVDRSLPITVREVVRMGRYGSTGIFGRFSAADKALVADALRRLDIADLSGRQLSELSGGQRQRAFVAQGIAQQADVLLLDEPVTGLDLVSRDRILTVIDEERDAGRAVVMTTHSLDEARRCDRVLLLANTAVAWGTPSEVITEANLTAAFGDGVMRLAGGGLHMDDPHHSHDHDHHDH